jgi:putative Mg2+ transporter-C (MgtC) family protein
MTWTVFSLHLGVALFLGGAIGFERQWRQTKGILKTNVLVCIGSSMFVMMSTMVTGDASPTRVAAQVVSGIGFLGGGIIFKDGSTIKGLNTAATLWCTAAVGTLVGGGFLFQAYISSAMLIVANLILRPLAEQIKFQPQNLDEPNTYYRFSLICDRQDELEVRDLLLNLLSSSDLMLNSLQRHSLDTGKGVKTGLEIEVMIPSPNNPFVEQFIQQFLEKAQYQGLSCQSLTAPPAFVVEDKTR